MEISQIASAHAGRPLYQTGIFLTEEDTYILSVDGQDISDGWQWILAFRPDLASYGSLSAIHTQRARMRWLTINHPSSMVELRREDGERTDYIFDWVTVENIWTITYDDDGREAARERQQLQLTSPDGEVLAVAGMRVLEYSRGNYPCGDYSHVYDEEIWQEPVVPA